MKNFSQGIKISNIQTFKGSEKKPLLAPRGVFVCKGKLFVSDTAQNRVFIWNQIPTSEYAEPDIVLGQSEVSGFGRNADGEVSSKTLQYPSGLWSDGQKLIVADAWNHRVLIWSELPTRNGQEADIVLGQKDFNSNQPNIKGIASSPDARSLNWCYGVYSDGKKLFIADTGNRRTLIFNNIPTQSYEAANAVIGQTLFEERDFNPDSPIWPYSVKISPSGHIAIPDTQFFRTLLWNNLNDATQKTPNIIIGQQDLAQSGQNQFHLQPQNNTLNWCYDVCFYKQGLFVCDTGNSRLLWFKNIPTQNNSPADGVIGKKDFTTGSENADAIFGTDQSLYWPFSITTEEDRLFIADTGNHRIVFCTLEE